MLPFLYIKFIDINDFVSTLCLVLLMCLSIPDNFHSVYRLIALPYSLAFAGHNRLFVISLALFTLFLLLGMFSFLSLQALKLSALPILTIHQSNPQLPKPSLHTQVPVCGHRQYPFLSLSLYHNYLNKFLFSRLSSDPQYLPHTVPGIEGVFKKTSLSKEFYFCFHKWVCPSFWPREAPDGWETKTVFVNFPW